MTKTSQAELITLLADKAKIPTDDVTRVIDAFLDVITSQLKEGSEIRFLGFGTFSVQSVAARTGRNPRTGEEIQIKASKKPVFKAGKTLKDTVNS